MSYSVGVKNIFELLDDETDDQPSVKTPTTKLDDDKSTLKAQAQKPIKKEGPVGDKPYKGTNQNRNKEGGAQRSPNPNYKPRGDRPPRVEGEFKQREPRAPRAEGDRPPRAPRAEGDRPPRAEGERPPRRPRTYEGGSAGQDGTARPPRSQPHGEERDKERWQNQGREFKQGQEGGKRVYDRKSGTGRGPRENKKGGAGGANWGSETDPKVELEAAQQVSQEAKTEQSAEEGAAATTEEAASPAADATEEKKKEPEEPEGVSLEEYKKLKEAKTAALPTLPPPRKAGEGVADKDKDKWAQVQVTEAKPTTTQQEKEQKEKTSKKSSVPLDKVFTIKPREENRPPREDRPPRKDFQQGGKRNDRKPKDQQGKNNSKPKGPDASVVKDDKEFPALATKA